MQSEKYYSGHQDYLVKLNLFIINRLMFRQVLFQLNEVVCFTCCKYSCKIAGALGIEV